MAMMAEENWEPTTGERVLFLRKRRGLSQQELSKRTGITQPTLSRIEAGKPLLAENARKLAIALDCSTDYLLRLKATPP
jgi:transcriptional regulator with XRE-family HTH domain